MNEDDESLDTLVGAKVRERESHYPAHWPATDTIWQSLAERRRRAKQKKFIWRVAATVLIFTMASYTLFLQHNSDDTVTRGHGYASLSAKEKSAIDYITRYCEEKNSSCNTPVIAELRYDLEQSFQKLDEINSQLQVYGNDSELIRAKTRIENHQARLIKVIVQTL